MVLDVVRIPTYILSGGKSRRFGSDKALARLGEQPLLVAVAERAASVSSRVSVVAERRDKYWELGLRTIGDVVPERGPLGGLLTAMSDVGPDTWLLVLSCDLVGFDARWVGLLDRSREGALAVAFRGDRWQPFPGLYHSSLRVVVQAAIRREELAMGRFLDAVNARALPLPSNWPLVVQANTAEELEQAGRNALNNADRR